MEKTFKLDPKPMPKGFYFIIGLMFILNGSIIIFSNNLQPLNLVMGVLTILGGIGYMFLSPFKSNGNILIPTVKIDSEVIRLKTGIWSRPYVIRWEDIREIFLDSYRINFKLKKSSQSFRYHCLPQTSIALKNAIREEADLRGITVTGG